MSWSTACFEKAARTSKLSLFGSKPLLQSALLRLYDRLTRNDSLEPAELIFVLAGRMERKRYALDLHRAGFAPRLLLSIGRFEVSKMDLLELEGLNELRQLRDQTPPSERHFFMDLDASGPRICPAELPRWNTLGEILALRRFIGETVRRVIVVSTDVHLRRVSMTIAAVFRGTKIEFRYCAVPPELSGLRREGWWTRRRDRRFVLKECVKLIGYRMLLALPQRAALSIMKLTS
jgi:hypothetical protein